MYNRLNNETVSDETSADGSKTEKSDILTAPIPGSYGSTPVPDKSVHRFYVPFCGMVFYIMAFFGFFCAFTLRESLSVAIVAMANQTTLTEMDIAMTNVSDQDECPRDPELEHEGGEFNWDRNQQAIVLAAFYYGYAITQVPGGFVADRFGGKWLFGGCILLSSIVSLLTPAAARIHIGVLITLRVLSGLGEGVILPAIQALIARWSTPQYRSIVVCVIFIGMDTGTIVGMFLTGVLCDYGFAGGWPSAFYVFGIVGCVWSVAWFFLCYNSPYTHPRISTPELEYWERTIGSKDLAEHPPTPWRKILTSVPVWGLAVAQFAYNWGYFTLVICLPLYMHDVLGFDMTKNGAFSAVPFIASLFTLPLYSTLADWLRSSGRLSTTVVRKTFCVVGFTATGCLLIVVGYIGCDRTLAVATLVAVLASSNVGMITVVVNQMDIDPLLAGKIMGLTHDVASLAAIGAPMAAGALTFERSTREEWQNVFFLAAGIYAVGAIVFLIFGSGDRQSWAD